MTVPDVERLIPETLEHPYLYFDRADLDRVRAICLDGSHAKVYAQTRERLKAAVSPSPLPRVTADPLAISQPGRIADYPGAHAAWGIRNLREGPCGRTL